jgi:hemerythrin-like metal-binding protein
MSKIEWTEEISVGISIFDEEHKKLIALLNKLNDAMLKGQAKNIMEDIIKELIDYTETHFKHEEDTMQKHNYPGLAEQVTEHTTFDNKMHEIQEQYSNGSITLSISVYNFLTSWIKNHIMKTDKKYSDFFLSVGIK